MDTLQGLIKFLTHFDFKNIPFLHNPFLPVLLSNVPDCVFVDFLKTVGTIIPLMQSMLMNINSVVIAVVHPPNNDVTSLPIIPIIAHVISFITIPHLYSSHDFISYISCME